MIKRSWQTKAKLASFINAPQKAGLVAQPSLCTLEARACLGWIGAGQNLITHYFHRTWLPSSTASVLVHPLLFDPKTPHDRRLPDRPHPRPTCPSMAAPEPLFTFYLLPFAEYENHEDYIKNSKLSYFSITL